MNSDSLDVLSGVAVGVFLLMVAVKGNSAQMVALAKRDKAFLKWAIAVGILFYMRQAKLLNGPVTEIIVAAFIGLFLIAGDKIIPQVQSFWKSIGA